MRTPGGMISKLRVAGIGTIEPRHRRRCRRVARALLDASMRPSIVAPAEVSRRGRRGAFEHLQRVVPSADRQAERAKPRSSGRTEL